MDRIIAFLLMTSLMLNFQNFDKNIYETQTISADIDKSSQIIDFSQTYNIHGEDVTFNFTASLNCCLPHICKYGGKRASFYVEILDSSTSSDVAYLNSPSQEYLKLSEINVKISKNDDISYIDLLGLEQTNRMIVTFEYTLINSYDYTDSYKGSYTTCIDLIVK